MNLLKLTQTIMSKLGYDEATGKLAINSDNLATKDPLLDLNTAESGPGVTAPEAGIQVMRGSGQAPAQLLYKEETQSWHGGLKGSEMQLLRTTDLMSYHTTQLSRTEQYQQRLETYHWMKV